MPVEVPDGAGGKFVFTTDEHPCPGTTVESLAASALHPELENPTITAGNSAGLNDAAAAVVVASSDTPPPTATPSMARIRSWASVGVTLASTGMAPIDAILKALSPGPV